MIEIRNIFQVEDNEAEQESFEELIKGSDFFVERIVTNRNYTKAGKWYNQENDEWVLLVQGEATLEFEDEAYKIKQGDYLLIPANNRHRILKTSNHPKCIWLTIHGKIK